MDDWQRLQIGMDRRAELQTPPGAGEGRGRGCTKSQNSYSPANPCARCCHLHTIYHIQPIICPCTLYLVPRTPTIASQCITSQYSLLTTQADLSYVLYLASFILKQ